MGSIGIALHQDVILYFNCEEDGNPTWTDQPTRKLLCTLPGFYGGLGLAVAQSIPKAVIEAAKYAGVNTGGPRHVAGEHTATSFLGCLRTKNRERYSSRLATQRRRAKWDTLCDLSRQRYLASMRSRGIPLPR